MSTRAVLAVGLLVALLLAVAASPFASSAPDGLEKVAAEKAFIEQGETRGFQQDAVIPDYAVPGIADARLATAAAGFAGVLLMAAVGFGFARVHRRRVS